MLFEREPVMLNVSPQNPAASDLSSDKFGITDKVKRLNEDFSQSIALEQTVMQLGGDHFKNIVTAGVESRKGNETFNAHWTTLVFKKTTKAECFVVGNQEKQTLSSPFDETVALHHVTPRFFYTPMPPGCRNA